MLLSGGHATAIEITDSSGKHRFDQPPERIVVVNWTLTEQVLALGVVPIGVAEIEAYNRAVKVLPVPSDVVEVGDRQSPNLDTIAALSPDVIIVGYSQKSLIRPLSRIAPVVYFKNFSRRYDNAQTAIERLRTLGRLLGQSSRANAWIQRLADTRDSLAQQIAERYPKTRPTVAAVQYQTDLCCWLHDRNSLIRSVLDELGFASAMPQPPNNFGVRKVTVKSLVKADQPDTRWLLFGSETLPEALSNAPFIAQQRYWQLSQLWGYGGVASLHDLYQQLASTLLGTTTQQWVNARSND